MKNYYKILEVNENASQEVIDKAYKVLVKKYHPDLQKNALVANAKIKEINEAYDVLSDSFLKEQYDKELQQERAEQNNISEEEYNRLYKEKERLKSQLSHEKYESSRITSSKTNVMQEEQINNSSAYGIIELIKSMFSHMPKLSSIKNIKKIDIIALLLTIAIVIGIGAILYFIPFTHDWMNRNFIDTPLVNWIKGLF